jgi:hypothetical protein
MRKRAKVSIPSVCVWLPLLAIALCTQAQSISRPENKPISLDGTIRLVHGFGPPGYGESPKSDAHVTYWAIETDMPVTVISDQPDFDCSPTKRLNLFFTGMALEPLMKLPAAKWRGQRVTVHGKIHCAETAGEMTSIYMDVETIEAGIKR